jgi:hypothetical protein
VIRMIEALRDGNYTAIAAALSERLGVEIDADLIEHRCQGAKIGWKDWADDTVFMWLKNRVADLLKPGCECNAIEFSVPIHVGFVFVFETPEMVKRLQNELDPLASMASIARSKISGTNLAEINPVDRVAVRVGPSRDKSGA